MTRRWVRVGATVLLAGAWLGIGTTLQAGAQEASTAAAAAADAYGLSIDGVTPARPLVQPPLARATQEAPPNAEEAAQANLLATGPDPAGGTVVHNIGALVSTAEADDSPMATATAQAAEVALITQSGVPLLTAGLVRAVSTTNCDDDPSGATQILDLAVAGNVGPIPAPGPNTELLAPFFNPLGFKVILNEQHLTADGRGIVVNAIHIYQFTPSTVPALFTGDVVVAHAMSTVNCPNGAGSTGDENPVNIVKEVDDSTATAGDELTYTATVQNRSEQECAVNRFIDHLPAPFEFVSTSGDFGDEATTVPRPGGGSDVILEPADMVIEAGGEATQTFVVKVKDDADPGVFFNNVELFCGNLGNWVKGLDAPVEVVGEETTPTTTTTAPPAQDDAVLAATGGWGFPAGGAAALFAAALLALRRRLA